MDLARSLGDGIVPRYEATSRRAREELPRAAIRELGALNRGRTKPNDIESARKTFLLGGCYALSIGLPLYSWASETIIRKFPSVNGRALIRHAFAAAAAATAFAFDSVRTLSDLERRGLATVGSPSTNSILVKDLGRQNALEWVREWLRSTSPSVLRIAEPYFKREDLEILKLVAELCPNCKVHLLLSQVAFKTIAEPPEDTLRDYWKLHLSDQTPPDTTIVIAGRATDGSSPIHDRWWISDTQGIRFGTSFASLGSGKSSEISSIDEVEASALRKEIDLYLTCSARDIGGVRLRYSVLHL